MYLHTNCSNRNLQLGCISNYFWLRLAFNLKCSLIETDKVLSQNPKGYLT